MADELSAVWRYVRSADDVRCAVLTGAGDRSFCTGIDRAEIPSDGAPFDVLTYDDPGQLLGPRSNQCWKPVIAAVNGMACGGAFYLLGESDFIIAADHATFFDPHVTFGMAAVYEPTLMLPRMPFGELARLTLLGVHTSACRRDGRSRSVSSAKSYPPLDLLATATGVAREIASQPPVAVQTSVRTLWAARELSRQQMLGVSNAFLAIATTPEALAVGQVVFNSGTRITPRIR